MAAATPETASRSRATAFRYRSAYSASQSCAHGAVGEPDELANNVVLGEVPSAFPTDLGLDLHDQALAVDEHSIAVEDHEVEGVHPFIV